MEEENLSFEQIYDIFKNEEPELIAWLDGGKSGFMTKIGSVEEVNQNMKAQLETKSYTEVFSAGFTLYAQAVMGILILPVMFDLVWRDKKYRTNEIIFSKRINSGKYFIGRYIASLINVFILVFITGLMGHLYICYKFAQVNWYVNYFVYPAYFLIYIVPSILFLSALIVLLCLAFKEMMPVFLIYLPYMYLLMTETVFTGDTETNTLYKSIVRLDRPMPYNNFVVLNRLLYIFLTIVLLFYVCRIYERNKHELEAQ